MLNNTSSRARHNYFAVNLQRRFPRKPRTTNCVALPFSSSRGAPFPAQLEGFFIRAQSSYFAVGTQRESNDEGRFRTRHGTTPPRYGYGVVLHDERSTFEDVDGNKCTNFPRLFTVGKVGKRKKMWLRALQLDLTVVQHVANKIWQKQNLFCVTFRNASNVTLKCHF